MIFKLTLVLFAFFALHKTYRQYKQKRVSSHWFTIWALFWTIVIFVAFLPETTDVLATYVGVEKGADLIVYIAVLVLTYGMYRVMVGQERLRKDITDLVRQIAILEAKKSEVKKSKKLS